MNPRNLTLATAGVLVLTLLGFLGYRQFIAPTGEVNTGAASGYADQPTLGREDAPVKLILFENFLCEHCKAFEEEAFPRIRSNYIETGQVEAYYVNLAWGPENATTAGLAGECAYRQDEEAFWDYKSALFEAQTDHEGSWATTDNLVTIARENVPALDTNALRTCIEEDRYLDEVQRDLVLGETVGVRGTPSLVIGDQGFQGPSYETIAAAIDQQLAGRD